MEYRVYNSDTGRSVTVQATSEKQARRKGKLKIGTKKWIVRAYKVKK